MNILSKLSSIVKNNNSLLCVGLDSEFERIPEIMRNKKYPQYSFNKEIIDATHEYVCAFKANSAFYEARGERGIKELAMTMKYIQKKYSHIVTICDAKRADIGNTNKGYVTHIYDNLGFDSVTLHPYLGREALQPFLDRKDKACIILCKTSNPGSGEFQNLKYNGTHLYEYVASQVANEWNINNNCMLVVGATYPEEMKKVRAQVGDMPFLIPGIGAQGGIVEETVIAGANSKKQGMIINSARDIIFASRGNKFAFHAGEKARKLRDEINRYINKLN